MWEEKKEW